MFLIGGGDMWLWNDIAVVLGLKFVDDVDNVFGHHLDGCHHAAMAQRGIRTHDGEIIGHIGSGDRKIGVGIL